MTFRPFLLALGLTALAHPASAFDAMDCVGVEYCTANGCTPSVLVFAISFDWTAQFAIVEEGAQTTRLDLASNEVNADGTSGSLNFINDDDAVLVLTFSGEAVDMLMFTGQGDAHQATCTAREAAT